MKYAIPIEANHRLADLLSDQTSNEAKATTARWFAEMMIDKFLSDSAKERLTNAKFQRLSLSEAIDEIKGDFSPALIEALQLIKSIGDKAAHYNKSQSLTAGETKQAIEKALQLFHFVLLDELIKTQLNATPFRATLFSTLMPKVREHVLQQLLSKVDNRGDYFKFLAHKYALACVKNNNHKKAKKFLDTQLEKANINQYHYEFEVKSIDKIKSEIDSQSLPIAQDLNDAKRNFNSVLSSLSSEEKLTNARLISIIERLLEEVAPSETGDYLEYANFVV